MTKTTIASPATAAPAAVRRHEPELPENRDSAAEPRSLADWELVLVGGGDMSPDW